MLDIELHSLHINIIIYIYIFYIILKLNSESEYQDCFVVKCAKR